MSLSLTGSGVEVGMERVMLRLCVRHRSLARPSLRPLLHSASSPTLALPDRMTSVLRSQNDVTDVKELDSRKEQSEEKV